MKHYKFYELRIFQRIQGTIVEICPVETWRIMTTKREAEKHARRYNREHYSDDHGQPFPDKWVAPVKF